MLQKIGDFEMTPEQIKELKALAERAKKQDAAGTIWEYKALEWGNFVMGDCGTAVCHSALSRTDSMQYIAAASPDVVLALIAENEKLRTALEDLYAQQNGAPLVKYAKQWQESMDKARAALGEQND